LNEATGHMSLEIGARLSSSGPTAGDRTEVSYGFWGAQYRINEILFWGCFWTIFI